MMPLPHAISSIALVLTFAVSAPAADQVSFTTADGREFHDVTVKGAVGRKLEVVTEKGVERVPFKNLPRDIQERFFDPSMLYPPKAGDVLDFTTRDGHKYKGTLSEVVPNGISIETPDGFEKIAYTNLPPELANTFGYDAEDAARYEAALRAQKLRMLAAQAAAEKKAAAQRAAAERSAAQSQRGRATPKPGESALGQSGTRDLGAPQLGGRGLSK